MTTKTKPREALVEAIERIHDAIDPNEEFETAYEARYVCTFELGLIIVDFNDDEVIDDQDDIARFAAIHAAFPAQIKALKKAVTKYLGDEQVERASHKFGLALLDILDTLK